MSVLRTAPGNEIRIDILIPKHVRISHPDNLSPHGGFSILEFKKVTRDYEKYREFMNVYLSSFPPNEIVEIESLLCLASKGCFRLESVEDDGTVIGMCAVTENTPVTFIAFLAVRSDLHSHGYGGAVLDMLMDGGKPTFLNVEPPNASSRNSKQRKRRIEFYEKHGLKLTDYEICLDNDLFRIMTDKEDCLDLYIETIGMLGFDWSIRRICS